MLYVDELKNHMNEGEVLFPPGSRFKVRGVAKAEEHPAYLERPEYADPDKDHFIVELEEY